MAVQIEHLSKKIGRQQVLSDISLSIGDGEIVALLGPNGAGKSTLMKIMVGLWEPTEGTVKVPTRHGYLPELNPLYDEMYVREYLQFMAGLSNSSNTSNSSNSSETSNTSRTSTTGKTVEDLISLVGLTPEANKKIGQLSKGYKQRVGLAQALLGDPELLILDEPTTGLDPAQLVEIRRLIRELGRNRTVILSTHILQEVQEMCSRVIILNHGKKAADKPIGETDNLEQLFIDATRI